MQIFTLEQVLQTYIQAQDLVNKLVGVLLAASFREIFNNLGIAFSSLTHGDWNTLAVSIFILFGMIVFVYRLARKKPLIAIKSIFGK